MTTKEQLQYELLMREKLLAYLKESQRLAYRRRLIVRRVFPIIRLATKLADFFSEHEMYKLSIFFGRLYLKYMRKAIDNCDLLTAKVKKLDHECKLIDILLGRDDETRSVS